MVIKKTLFFLAAAFLTSCGGNGNGVNDVNGGDGVSFDGTYEVLRIDVTGATVGLPTGRTFLEVNNGTVTFDDPQLLAGTVGSTGTFTGTSRLAVVSPAGTTTEVVPMSGKFNTTGPFTLSGATSCCRVVVSVDTRCSTKVSALGFIECQ